MFMSDLSELLVLSLALHDFVDKLNLHEEL